MVSRGDVNLMLDPEQAIPATKVELSVSCRNLLDMDTFSKSDPFCVMYTKPLASDQFKEFGRTEIIMDNLNPTFVKKFVLDFFFEEVQKLRFEIYDSDSKSPDLRKHDFIGCIECTMGEIMGSAGGKLVKRLSGKVKNCGNISIRGEELSSCRDMISFAFRGENLDKKDFLGKSDPFLVFYRMNDEGGYTICHKTEVIKKTLNPTWKPFDILLRALCNADYDKTIKIECYDWDRDGGHDFIGEFTTTMRQLSRGPNPDNVYQLINPKKKQKKGNKYKNSGLIFMTDFRITPVHSFLDYIQGGTQLNFTVAVDFTASNGDPRQATSLHYMNPYQPNCYLRALRAVGDVIQDYDTDKLFPALGFGARVPPTMQVSHEFFMNGRQDSPYCEGVDGIISAYQYSLNTVQLYGPTNFAPVIYHVARFAAAKRDGSEYFVLLILTDGIITDMAKTTEAIVKASSLPLSIIIIGVGNEDFSAMEVLDGDDVRLSFQGRPAERDIVQFVPFRDFENANNAVISQAQLAKEVLEEVPDQFLSYMRKNGIKPRPRRDSVSSQMSMLSVASAPPPPPY